VTAFVWPQGVMTALVTPLRDDVIDRDALASLIEYQITNGAKGLVVSGGTGEYNYLTLEEREELFRDTVQFAAGRAKVIAAPGCLATRDTLRLCKAADAAGADGLLVTSAFGEPINFVERVNYFEEVGSATDLPVMVYNTPPAGLLTFEQIRRLSEITNVCAVKDSSGDPTLMGDILAWSAGTEFGVYVGLDSFLYEAVMAGAHGAVFGTANFLPAELSRLLSDMQVHGRYTEAKSAWDKIRPILRFMEHTNNYVAMCKAGCRLRGIDVGHVRKPNLMPAKDEIDELANWLETLD